MTEVGVELEGRTAVVTGASRGIGQAIAVALAAEGADVVLAARSAEGLEETSGLVSEKGREALSVETDVVDPDSVQGLADTALEKFGKVDVLVNNSGVEGPTEALWDMSPEDFRQVIDVNLVGAYLCCRALLPSMTERGEGSVVMIGSVVARRPVWGRTPYAASKLGLLAMAQTLAHEAGPHGVRVNVVSPGAVAGERLDRVMQAQADRNDASLEEVREQFKGLTPLRTMVEAEDVAQAVTFLAGPRSGRMTGEDMNVTAGLHVW